MKFPYNKVLTIKGEYQAGIIDREAAKEQLAYILDLKDDSDFCEQAAEKSTQYSKPTSYGPLVRLSDVCNILRIWAGACSTFQPEDHEHTREERLKFSNAWSFVDIQISKSCLLWRLFFTEEGVRQIPCPEHKGRWSGCTWNSPGCECRNGSNVTGWLPEPEFTGYDDESTTVCDFCGKPPLIQGLWSSRVDGKHGHPECMDANPMPLKVTS